MRLSDIRRAAAQDLTIRFASLYPPSHSASRTADRFGADLPVIDAHQHFWNLDTNYHPWLCDEPAPRLRYGDYRPLRRNILPADYRRDSAAFDIVATVVVEAEWDPRDSAGEVAWLDDLIERDGLASVIVAAARLDDPDVADLLARHAQFPRVRGIRHKPRVRPRPASGHRAIGSMSEGRWRRGYALLETHDFTFDLQVPWWHLYEAAELARDFPGIGLVIDHAGQIDARDAETMKGWRSAIEAIADAPTVMCKISGLGLADRPWDLRDNLPVIRHAIAIFGAERCMFGSNYPVDSLVGSFAAILNGVFEASRVLGDPERTNLFSGTARRFYRIPAALPPPHAAVADG